MDWKQVRGVHGFRLFVSVGLAAAVLAWFYFTDPFGGKDTITRAQFLALSLVAALPAYLVLRVLSGEARGHDAWRAAMRNVVPDRSIEHLFDQAEASDDEKAVGEVGEAVKRPNPIAAAILWAARMLSGALIYWAILSTLGIIGSARAAELPAAVTAHAPLLRAEVDRYWPDAPDRVALAAQVEQETCVSLRSRSCWSPRAELKTPREYGFGLGQLTVTQRFNNFDAAKRLDATLVHWAWEDRFDAARQLRVLVLMDRQAYRAIANAPDPRERLAMALSAYNGGTGGLSADRRLCGQVAGCDPRLWFGNVERTSLKARAKTAGYGQSFFDINRGYVRAILVDRRQRYTELRWM